MKSTLAPACTDVFNSNRILGHYYWFRKLFIYIQVFLQWQHNKQRLLNCQMCAICYCFDQRIPFVLTAVAEEATAESLENIKTRKFRFLLLFENCEAQIFKHYVQFKERDFECLESATLDEPKKVGLVCFFLFFNCMCMFCSKLPK